MIKRKLLSDLKGHLSKKEISLIVGPRQAGKTTLMLMLKEYLEKQGENTLFLSFDFEADRNSLSSQSSLIQKIRLESGEKRSYVFIDEVQRKENAGLFLKGLYDMKTPYKFIVSGSGSLELKEKIHESLVGRKRVFELNTLTFEEFVNFRTDYHYEDKLYDFFQLEKARTKELLYEYLNFGGYPALVLETELKEKRMIMDEIYRSVIEKDLTYLLRIEKTEAFTSLIKILSGQTGGLVNYSEISSTVGISVSTVKNYLWYAEKTFIIEKITPFFRNIRKEITKSPVYYFYDLGLRNFIIGLMGNLTIPYGAGFLFQNLVLHILKEKIRHTGRKIHFWRTKDRAEVDFILESGQDIIPVEVKFKEITKNEIGRSLRNFISKYQPRRAWIINLSLEKNIRLNNTQVSILPFYKLIDTDFK
ncbi:MAG TPA: ATP-binding protein [Nitrospirae bacterium]|nr:archaeal ATPase [bacterium BMS3Abin06]HDH13094.1 ATP-binding protein [Nitrospirota bacterium]HDZ02108.1 ATP-binding protein [Nitrospirota bacterium]